MIHNDTETLKVRCAARLQISYSEKLEKVSWRSGGRSHDQVHEAQLDNKSHAEEEETKRKKER